MIDRPAAKIAVWPFVVVDLLFLGLAGVIFSTAHRPLTVWEELILVVCAAIGAWSFLTPFLKRNATEVKLAESENLNTTVAQIKNLEMVAAQINHATSELKTAQDDSKQTAISAKHISERMTEERRAFTEFMQKANDTEKGHLRLEVEKLRRTEVDWIQILVHILDQIYALHQAAVKSGKLALIEQIGNFQMACRDAARRVGLVWLTPEVSSPFDEKAHQLMDGQAKAESNARIAEVLAPGYSYQGRQVRRPLVGLQTETDVPENTAANQSELEENPLDKISSPAELF